MTGKNTANIGFEKQIWDAACVLRGNMDASEYKNVVLGLIFLKYISDRFDEKQEGKRGGEFFTPSCVVRTLVEVLQPFKGRVYDPCCGSGGMFVQSAKFVENHSGNISNISIYGQCRNKISDVIF